MATCGAGCEWSEILDALELTNGRASPKKTPARRKKAKKKATKDFGQVFKGYRARCGPKTRKRLAKLLNTTPQALARFGVGSAGPSVLVIAERDARGQIIGVWMRHADGTKRVEKGGHRGLILPTKEAAAPPERLIICEGATDTLAVAGQLHDELVIGLPHKAGALAELATYVQRIGAKKVVLILDRDDDGAKVAAALPIDVHAVRPPGGTKDIREAIAAGLTSEDLGALLDTAQLVSAWPLVDFDEGTEERPIVWLYPGRIPFGMVTLFCGQNGAGKTQCLTGLIRKFTRGEEWPDGGESAHAGHVLYLSTEECAHQVLKRRFRKHGVDLRRVHRIQVEAQSKGKRRPPNVKAALGELEATLRVHSAIRFVVLDPVASFTGAMDRNEANETRNFLERLGEIASERNVAIVGITHFNKATGVSAVGRIFGSSEWANVVRIAWSIGRHPERQDVRVLSELKNNLGVPTKSLTYQIGDDGIAWLGTSTLSADDVLRAAERPRGVTKVDRARSIILRALGPRPLPAARLREAITKAGISERTGAEARSALRDEGLIVSDRRPKNVPASQQKTWWRRAEA